MFRPVLRFVGVNGWHTCAARTMTILRWPAALAVPLLAILAACAERLPDDALLDRVRLETIRDGTCCFRPRNSKVGARDSRVASGQLGGLPSSLDNGPRASGRRLNLPAVHPLPPFASIEYVLRRGRH